MTKHRCPHLISYEMEGLTAIAREKKYFFLFSLKVLEQIVY